MADDRQAHLGMIQGVINRLARNSFMLKGWSVLLVSALLAYAANESEELILFVAFLPAISFWILDGYYLWKERLYRILYDQVRKLEESQVDYQLDVSNIPCDEFKKTWFGAMIAPAVSVFYLMICATICSVIIYSSC
ncbi:hypothetical protein [Candidatus Poriferisocius sp.]|uniref:hypothetical protein n=1 Tax=Candidatus Poriferisocius sp. TaxID=3101276 RepID=UPI003B023BE8